MIQEIALNTYFDAADSYPNFLRLTSEIKVDSKLFQLQAHTMIRAVSSTRQST